MNKKLIPLKNMSWIKADEDVFNAISIRLFPCVDMVIATVKDIFNNPKKSKNRKFSTNDNIQIREGSMAVADMMKGFFNAYVNYRRLGYSPQKSKKKVEKDMSKLMKKNIKFLENQNV